MALSIPELFRQYRTKRRLTLEAAASMFGITKQALSQWESGRYEPGIAALNEMCGSTDATIRELGNKVARIRFPLLDAIRED